jgi:small subunit ribosomal protein S8
MPKWQGTLKFKCPIQKQSAPFLTCLVSEGYVQGYSVSEEVKAVITVQLKYHNGGPVIEEIARVSRPGLRIYKESNDIPRCVVDWASPL